ncbi:uncharacterized protein LOC134243595 [Saccostrea cucullata]|uniref:uncharacterized protein LOC134243595 n=1 Tax=Saccostrea cuccullata TaxID=36930 RepID=UPI002ED51915
MNEVPDTAQHYIECDTESCINFSVFYCNTCHQRICDQCKQRHLELNKEHDIVLYRRRKKKLPSEKCKIHPTEKLDIFCDVCQDPLCSTCFDQDHSDHGKSDLETIYNDILQRCQKEINDIWNNIPKAKDNIESMKNYVKNEIAKIRVSMQKRADELKMVVNSVLTDNNKKLDEIENSVLNHMGEQQKKTKDYTDYLEGMIVDYESKMSSIKPTELMTFHSDISLATLKMTSKSEPNLPNFTFGTLNKEEIAKQFGEIELDLSERFEPSSITKVKEVALQRPIIYHLSQLPPNKFWASDILGNLTQYDMEGNILKIISTNIGYIQGNHTVTTEGNLLYTDNDKNTVYRVSSDMSINKFFETGKWKAGAIYSSPVNGNILIVMEIKPIQKITKYSREGRKLQDIQWDDKGKTLYKSINYITENINGDICASDWKAGKVVVVTASGEYRFTYSGHHSQSQFRPFGICTDVLGNILVCNGYFTNNENCTSIHLLDLNGQCLSLLLTPKQCPPRPCALCIDKQHNLWVGTLNIRTVFVYKYLQNTNP